MKPKAYFCSQVGKFIQEQAAVYLTAALESVMEEVVVLCLGGGGEVTTSLLEQTIASNPELWGIFQVFQPTLRIYKQLNKTTNIVWANQSIQSSRTL